MFITHYPFQTKENNQHHEKVIRRISKKIGRTDLVTIFQFAKKIPGTWKETFTLIYD